MYIAKLKQNPEWFLKSSNGQANDPFQELATEMTFTTSKFNALKWTDEGEAYIDIDNICVNGPDVNFVGSQFLEVIEL